MTAFAAALAAWALAALAALLPRRVAGTIAAAATVAGAACLAAAVAHAFAGAVAWEAAWVPAFGPLALRLDPVAGVFLAPIALVGALAAVYAPAYAALGTHAGSRAERALLPLLLAAMALTIAAANTVLLLFAWELVTLVSWALLSADHHDADVRAAGLQYLVAGHVSGAALALLFVLLSVAGGWRLPVSVIAGPGAPAPLAVAVLVLLGFGTKAAVAPLHVWLPDAHAAAPSHVSALMSGVLVTLGTYGLVRFLPLVPDPSHVLAIVVLALGAIGAAGGIVMALAQSDVKRVLAYSTVENAGIVVLAIGTALLAAGTGHPAVAALAWTAALLHVWNHAVSKSLLFLAAGAIARLAGSRDLDRWGGLLRRLPLAGSALLAGAASIVGLPGTHGFASVWLLLLALLAGLAPGGGAERAPLLLALVALAFTEGAALACFVRVAGIGLLGHPRSAGAAAATPRGGRGLAIALLVPAALCFALTALARPLLALVGGAVATVTGAPVAGLARLAAPLPWLALLPPALAVAIVLLRTVLARTRSTRTTVTWDCGYARPAASMQYTAGSLAQPVTRVLAPALRTSVRWDAPHGLWPASMRWESRTPERALAEIYRPAFTRLAGWLGTLRRLHTGRVTVYVRHLGLALLLLLAWLFWPVAGPR